MTTTREHHPVLIQHDSYHLLLNLLTSEQRDVLYQHALSGEYVAYPVPQQPWIWDQIA